MLLSTTDGEWIANRTCATYEQIAYFMITDIQGLAFLDVEKLEITRIYPLKRVNSPMKSATTAPESGRIASSEVSS
jgi:hypothetical protein